MLKHGYLSAVWDVERVIGFEAVTGLPAGKMPAVPVVIDGTKMQAYDSQGRICVLHRRDDKLFCELNQQIYPVWRNSFNDRTPGEVSPWTWSMHYGGENNG